MQTSTLGLVPFRGSAAIAEGLLTRDALRSRRFVRVFPDVYVAAGVEHTHAVVAAATTVLLPGAVISGVSAREVAGVLCALLGDPVEVTVPPGWRGVAVAGLRVRRRPLPAAAAARRPHVEAVVVLDQVVALRAATPASVTRWAEQFRGRDTGSWRLPPRTPTSSPSRRRRPGSDWPCRPAPCRCRRPSTESGREPDAGGEKLPEDRARLNELQELGRRVFYVTRAEMRDWTALIAAITRVHDASAALRVASQG